ncbi:MAG: hypothetical protein AAFO82_20960, partial [Bacteroidota bacterium]
MTHLLSKIIQHYDQLKYALLEAQGFDKGHFGFPEIYYEIMESDRTRIGAFQQAFEQYDCTDKVVCEAGVGRLALSKFYLPKVKKAYLIESNPHLHQLIQKTIEQNQWQNKVELIFGDAKTVQLPEKVDFIVGELMSIYCANEQQVQIFQHLRQFLHPQGKLLPQKVINIAQLAHASFEENHQHYPIYLTRHLPTQYSLQTVINTIDFYRVNSNMVKFSCEMTPILSGIVNAIYMRSYIEIVEGCNFTGTDSLMPPTVCQLR